MRFCLSTISVSFFFFYVVHVEKKNCFEFVFVQIYYFTTIFWCQKKYLKKKIRTIFPIFYKKREVFLCFQNFPFVTTLHLNPYFLSKKSDFVAFVLAVLQSRSDCNRSGIFINLVLKKTDSH